MVELPNIYLFNPTSDFAIANGDKNWQPNKTLQKMEADLATLPMFFATNHDIVLVDEMPDVGFIKSMNELCFKIPDFVLKKELNNSKSVLYTSKNRLIPWGWSPAAHQLFAPLKNSCAVGFRNSPVFNWSEKHREISSRKFALDILFEIAESLKKNWIIGPDQVVNCNSPADIEIAVTKWEKIILKAPWSSSGRGLQPITKTPIHPKVWEKINAVIREQGYIMAERLQKKVHDMAFIFEMKEKRARFLGVSHFFTNNKGQYAGNWLNGLPNNMSPEIADFIRDCINELVSPMTHIIEKSILAELHEGIFGIDMLIFKDNLNRLRINPCLEINVRHTMGAISLQLENKLITGNKVLFNTYYQSGQAFMTFKTTMEQKHPLKVRDGKYESGFVALTPCNPKTEFGAYLLS